MPEPRDSPLVVHVAVDLGASSGRVIAGWIESGRLRQRPIRRFPNRPFRDADGTLRWDLAATFREVCAALADIATAHPTATRLTVGIDTWAVDYCLVDSDGQIAGAPRHYRDAGIEPGIERVHDRIPPSEMYRVTGIQFLPFNTVYQLATDDAATLPGRTLLMVPDVLAYWLTGQIGTEVTNASSTGLFDPRQRRWSDELIGRLGIRRSLFPEAGEPGTLIGPTQVPHGGRTFDVIRVATHDTASAVVATPANGSDWAYISSGTWSLVGVELADPIVTEAAQLANFTNELGADHTVRYLRNVAGMWLLQESMRTWRDAGRRWRVGDLLAAASRRPAGGVIDPNDPDLLAPGDLPARITRAAAVRGITLDDDVDVIRCIIDSLASTYRSVIDQLETTSGRQVDVVHVVGGGSRNRVLCQATADVTGRPVLAGPTEASSAGNLLIQARAAGAVTGGLDALRQVVRRSSRLAHYRPQTGGRER